MVRSNPKNPTISYKELSRKSIISDLKKIISTISKNNVNSKKDLKKSIIVGIDSEKTSVAQHKRISCILSDSIKSLGPGKVKFQFKDSSEIFNDLRKIKREDEIENVKKACEISDSVFSDTIQWLIKSRFNNKSNNRSKSITEEDVVVFMKKNMIDKNVEESFPTIVASGKNAFCPHHTPSGKLLDGFCIIDFGVKYNGYCSDTTRTIFIGSPGKKEIAEYESLLEIQENALMLISPGLKLSVLDSSVRKQLGKDAKFFIHSLGHGVGLEVHERPFFSNDKSHQEIFQEGMILAIEPGIYKNTGNSKRAYGIRIEDMVLVGKKPLVLTKAPKHLVFI